MEVVEAKKTRLLPRHLTFLDSTVCFKDVESFSLNREAKKFEAKNRKSSCLHHILQQVISGLGE